MSANVKTMSCARCTKSSKRWPQWSETWSRCRHSSSVQNHQPTSSQGAVVSANYNPSSITRPIRFWPISKDKCCSRTIWTWKHFNNSRPMLDIKARPLWKAEWTPIYQRIRCALLSAPNSNPNSNKTSSHSFKTWTWTICKLSNLR